MSTAIGSPGPGAPSPGQRGADAAGGGGTTDAARGKGSPRALLGVASIAVALAAADTYVVVLALQDMMAGVGIGFLELQKATPIISGFLLGYIAVLPLIGRLADLIDRRRILLACLAVFFLGSVITALSTDLSVMVAGRVLQGVGGGGLVPATLALVADLWPRGERGTPLGVVGGVQEFGSVLGPLLGALILALGTWREIFWVNAVLAVALSVLIWWLGRGVHAAGRTAYEPGHRHTRWGRATWLRALTWLAAVVAAVLGVLALWAPESLVSDIDWGVPFVPFDGYTSKVMTPIGVAAGVALLVAIAASSPRWLPLLRAADWLGALLIAVALGSIVLTFSTADPEKEVLGPWGLWLLPVGAAALAAYVWRHRRIDNPLIGKGVMRGRVWPALVVSAMVGVALVSIIVTVVLLARITYTSDQTQASLVLMRFLVAVPVGAVVGGRLLRRYGPGVVSAPGLGMTAVALYVMSTWGEGSIANFALSTLVLVVAGFGIGLAIAPVNDAALADAPEDAHGMASALVVVARMVGMVVGLAVLMAIGLRRYYNRVEGLEDKGNIDAILDAGIVQCQTIFFGAAIAAVIATVVALWLGRRPVAHDREAGPALGL